MRVFIFPDSDQTSEAAAAFIRAGIAAAGESPRVVFPTGGTAEDFYAALQAQGADFGQIEAFHLDNYVGLKPELMREDYGVFLTRWLFDPMNVPEAQRHVIAQCGTVEEAEAEAARYDALVSAEPIDLCILGIGVNGHIAFNEPGTPKTQRTSCVRISENTRVVNARYFPSLEDVPTHAISMGIANIREARRILLVAHGARKAMAVDAGIGRAEDEVFPVSLIQDHSDYVMLLDNAAAAYVLGRAAFGEVGALPAIFTLPGADAARANFPELFA
jgi:glucosamine-6-phosphate deaminase